MAYTPTEWESADVVTAVRMNALENAVGDIDMSYTPNVWSDGDILTADKMNALEQAVASGGGGTSVFPVFTALIVNDGDNDASCDLTYTECVSLIENANKENTYPCEWTNIAGVTYFCVMEYYEEDEAIEIKVEENTYVYDSEGNIFIA